VLSRPIGLHRHDRLIGDLVNGGESPGTFQACTFKAKGRIDRFITPVVIFPPFDPKLGRPPKGYQALALWDTGATRSVIRPEIVAALALQATGTSQSHTAGGQTTSPTHVINIGLPNQTLIAGVLASENPNLNGFQAIIGMDVITLGDFAITSMGGQTWMSFRCPSVQHIDYVAEQKQPAAPATSSKISRNSHCPCGKKKPNGIPLKYKQCCGA
jgi:hypothetical protein